MKKMIFFGGFVIMLLVLAGCNYSELFPLDETVEGAKGLRDGKYVKITGNIDEFLFENYFKFSDSTGSITVEIENEIWARNGVNPASLTFPILVEIIGEIDKEKNQETIIEVESLKIK